MEYHFEDTVRWISEMRLRDYFAAQAMQANMGEPLMSKTLEASPDAATTRALIARAAYHMADAMLVERAKEKP